MDSPSTSEAGKAKLWLVILSLVWGLSWPIMRIALEEVEVWTMRTLGFTISAIALTALLKLQGRNLFTIPRGIAWLHVVVACLMIVIGFSLFSSFAQLAATTSRVVIVNYSMPVWGSLLAWLVLGERPSVTACVGLALCVAGLAALIYPVATAQSANGLLLALGCSVSWAAGTVYLKWARIPADMLTVTTWQVIIGALAFDIGYLALYGAPVLTPVSMQTVLAITYNGLIGTGLAYLLWFGIVERLPMATASLGLLGAPVVGVVASVLLLGERPTLTDIVGFALILAAAVCVLIPSAQKR